MDGADPRGKLPLVVATLRFIRVIVEGLEVGVLLLLDVVLRKVRMGAVQGLLEGAFLVGLGLVQGDVWSAFVCGEGGLDGGDITLPQGPTLHEQLLILPPDLRILPFELLIGCPQLFDYLLVPPFEVPTLPVGLINLALE